MIPALPPTRAGLVIATMMRLMGHRVNVYPTFSCQYSCHAFEERGMYCLAACYALDGFDLSGAPYT